MKSVCPHPECSKAFTSDFNLQRHLKASHLKERPFQCPDCFLTFGYRHVLLHHRLKKHPSPQFYPVPSYVQSLSSPLLIPKLTHLLQGHTDPVLGCYVHINRIFMFPVIEEEVCVPPLDPQRHKTGPLPTLAEAIGKRRRTGQARIMD